ncbi:MAG TPA: LOG family protein [Candidatus Paceibacterota bacterium]
MKNRIFRAFEKKKKDNNFRVAIFGSSRIEQGDVIYDDVKRLAEMLGESGIDVITGGGPGLMRAGNEGHMAGKGKAKNDSVSIGIGVELPWHQKFNNSVEYKEMFNRFSKRLDEFMLLSNAVVVAPGGLGTMLELFYTWQLVQVHHICNIPIILMGDEWEGLLRWIKENPLEKNYLDKADYDLVFHVKNPEDAVKIIEDTYASFKAGGKDFCLNYEKYKI